jgi:hypothetical protein
MSFRRSLCKKNLTRVLKIVCYNPRKWPETDVFVKTHLQTRLARRPTLVVLCLKLWSARGGGTVRVRNASFSLPFG